MRSVYLRVNVPPLDPAEHRFQHLPGASEPDIAAFVICDVEMKVAAHWFLGVVMRRIGEIILVGGFDEIKK